MKTDALFTNTCALIAIASASLETTIPDLYTE